MTMTALPSAPLPTDDNATFNSKAFALLGALAGFVTEANATEAAVDADAAAALAHKNAAATSETNASDFASAAAGNAAAAATSAGAAIWAAGSYSTGQAARSPSNMRVYIARTTGSKPTDPALDPTNWQLAYIGSLSSVDYAGTTATVSLGELSRFTNSAAVAVTVPAPTGANQEWAGEWENGLYTNTFDIGAATLRRNGASLTGVIANNKRMPIHLVSVASNEWRFAV